MTNKRYNPELSDWEEVPDEAPTAPATDEEVAAEGEAATQAAASEGAPDTAPGTDEIVYGR